MGTRSKDNHSKGMFGAKCFSRADYQTTETLEKVIPPDPKTGAPSSLSSWKHVVTHKNVISVLRPHRGRDRSKFRKVGMRGRRPMTFNDVLKHNIAVKKREELHTKPGILQKIKSVFQRKAK